MIAPWGNWRWPGCSRKRRTSCRSQEPRGSIIWPKMPPPARYRLLPGAVERMDALINANTVSGPRYNATTLPEIDTEGS